MCTQAAKQLNLTQSATSAGSRRWRRVTGSSLFDRIGRGIVLTPAGRDFLSEAREVVARAKAAAQVLNDLAGLKRGLLNVAASQTVANYWLPHASKRFARPIRHRSAHHDRKHRASRDAIHRGDADIGFVEGEMTNPCCPSKMEGDSL